MYERIRLENFRALRDASVDDLGRINLIVGPNSTGKTSILEALWLLQAPGNPTMTVNVATFRGFTSPPPILSSSWLGLFGGLQPKREIRIGGQHRDGHSERLEIKLSNEWAEGLDLGGDGTAALSIAAAGNTVSAAPETLVYDYVADGRPVIRSSISVGIGRTAIHVAPDLTPRPAIFLAARHRTTSEELADRFTKLQDAGGARNLVTSLAAFQPGLTDLSIGYRLDGQQAQLQLRAHVEGLNTPIPLQLLGEGAGRLAEILLASAFLRDDELLLVDEIENGLYYRNLESAWRAIDASTQASKVQLVATTHSAECVQAAVRALNGPSAGDFRLYRLERTGEAVRTVKFDHEAAEAALEFDLEFR